MAQGRRTDGCGMEHLFRDIEEQLRIGEATGSLPKCIQSLCREITTRNDILQGIPFGGSKEVSEKLKQAREYEERMEKNPGIPRPKFHLSSRIGWMNDPNGFSSFAGEYHLFYQ